MRRKIKFAAGIYALCMVPYSICVNVSVEENAILCLLMSTGCLLIASAIFPDKK